MRGLFGVDRHPKSRIWRVRIEVPTHLRPLLGNKAGFTKSLGTLDEAIARDRAPAAQAPFLQAIQQAQQAFDAAAAQRPVPVSLSRDTAAAAIAGWVASAQASMADAIWRHGRGASLALIFPEFGENGPVGFDRDFREDVVAAYGRPGAPPAWDAPLRKLLRRIMTGSGTLVPPDGHPATEAAVIMLLGAVTDLSKRQRDLMEGDWSVPDCLRPAWPIETHLPAAVPTREANLPNLETPRGSTITVNSMVERHIAKVRPAKGTESEMRLAARRLLAFLEVSDIEVHCITFAQSEAFFDALLHLPTHMREDDWKRGVKQLVADHIAGRDTRPRLSRPTVAKTISLLGAMQSRAAKRGYTGHLVFGGLVSKEDTKPVVPRHPFTSKQITTIFTSPIFTGCADPKNWREPGLHRVDDERRWIPLLAASMGLRLEEVGQLLVPDVTVRQGVMYLNITEAVDPDDDDEIDAADVTKSLKTSPSRRRLPLHPAMIAAGFPEYVERRRQSGDTRLFPNLKIDTRQKWTSGFSK